VLVAFFFAARAGVGLLTPDAYDSGNQACECEVESSIEEVELHDGIEVFDLHRLDVMPARVITPSLSTIVELSRSVDRPLFLTLELVRGPPG
jgi:hypothetical protein